MQKLFISSITFLLLFALVSGNVMAEKKSSPQELEMFEVSKEESKMLEEYFESIDPSEIKMANIVE